MTTSRLAACKRFSLRSLLLFLTACCLLLAVWSIYVNPFRLQARAVDAVSRLGGGVVAVPADGPVWQRWLVTIVGRTPYVHVTSVKLAGRDIDSEVIRSLRRLAYLRELDLDRTRISDEVASALESLTELDSLSLRFSSVSDSSARNLAALPKLTTLYLTGTHISDAAISDLVKLQGLDELYIRWSHISEAGAQRLREALPSCAVYYHALANESAAENHDSQ